MEPSTEQLILSELQSCRSDLRQFRDEVNDWKVEIAKQLAEHDTKITDVSGNGQPGRMTKAEEEISGLKRTKWIVVGWSTGVCGLLTVLFELVRMYSK